MYKAVFNDNYLCHYNKNHSKTNGQFTSGDGDGDGISNDHANQNKKKGGWKNMSKGQKALAITGLAVGTAGLVAGSIGLAKEFSKANMGKKLGDATIKGATSSGKNWWDNNKTYQRISAEAESRIKTHEKYQPKGWDKNVSLKSSPFGDAYKTVASGKYGTIYAR